MIIMMLAEQGRMGLDDNLRPFFPEIQGITIRHLLHRSSGIPDPYGWYRDNMRNWYGLSNSMCWP